MQDARRKPPRFLLIGFLIVLVGTNLVNYFMFGFQPHPVSPEPPDQDAVNVDGEPYKLQQEFALFEEVLTLIREIYVDPVDLPLLVRGAIRGTIEALGDPGTTFYDSRSRELQEFHTQIKGSFYGIGVRIVEVEGNVVIFQVIPGTPAERAGLYPGDRIIIAAGEELTGQGVERAVELIRGEKGTSVTISIERPGAAAPLSVTIERDEIKMASVSSRWLEPGLGYIQISNFDGRTGASFARQLQELEAAGLGKGLILDLRYNPGGLVEEAVKVGKLLVPEGEITRLVGRDGEIREIHYSNAPPKPYPLVVLINEETASAAEIVAGALQDRGAALLVGVRSYGKATVQHLQYLSGRNALRITVYKYLTPLGHDIHGRGLEPDYAVELPAVLRYYRHFFPGRLTQGSYGMEVRLLQEILVALEYPVTVSGIFDEATAGALSEFQAHAGLSASGDFDDMTWILLREILDQLSLERDPQLQLAIELTGRPGLWADDRRP
jgi:carboxyl-terminal processing protease